jgi:AcrR family transcriptional regulator
MARSVPPDRFAQLIAAATGVFVAQGYARTQMQDVADTLGVAKGTLYATVTSKEALLLACLRYADGLEDLPTQAELPLPTPLPGELVSLVTSRLTEVADLELHRIARTRKPGPASDELTAILTDLMERLTRHRRAIKLVDRCAPEIAGLTKLWFGAGRADLVTDLADYLRRRAASGAVRAQNDYQLVARTLVETCVFWAVHRHFDAAPAAYGQHPGDGEATNALLRLFLGGLTPEENA